MITVRLVVFVTVSVVMMFMDHRYQTLNSVRSTLSVIVYPLQMAIELPGSISEWFHESLASRRQLQEENASLRTQQLMMEAQVQKLASLESENIRLRELLGSSFEIGERILAAELMSINLDPYQHQVMINKGETDAVYPGQPILDAKGIMGQVVHVGLYTSTAVLITDTSHAIPVQVNRTGMRTIAVGSGRLDQLILPYIHNNADIRPGDLLISSGLGGRFPQGYPVATVEAVQLDPGKAFANVVATPSALIDRSREVLLVWPAELKQEDAPFGANETPVATEPSATPEEESP